MATLKTSDCANTFTTGTLYQSGQIVLNENCMVHIKDYPNKKKRKMMAMLEKHKVVYTNEKRMLILSSQNKIPSINVIWLTGSQ